MNLTKISKKSYLHKLLKNENFILYLLLIFIFLFLTYVSLYVFKAYPVTADEHHYFMQSFFYLKGNLCYDFTGFSQYWLPHHTVKTELGFCSPYPPGFSLILMIGILLKIPYLVNPFLATIGLLVAYKILRSFKISVNFGLIAIILAVTNPYFFGYAASYFSQSLALLLISLILLNLRYYQLSNKIKFMLFVGMFTGYLFLTRQLDAICIALFLICYSSLNDYKKLKNWIWVPPFILGVILLISYYYTLLGEFKISAASIKSIYPISYIYENFPQSFYTYCKWFGNQFLNNLTSLYLQSTLKYSGFVLYTLAFFGLFYTKLEKRWILYSMLLTTIFILAYTGAPFQGWPIYGARYTYPLFIIAIILSVSFLARLKKSFSLTIIILTIFSQILFLNIKLTEYQNRFNYIELVWNDIAEQCNDKSGVILPSRLFFANKHFADRGVFLKTASNSGHNPYNNLLNNKRFYITTEYFFKYLKKAPNAFTICKYNPKNLAKFHKDTVKKNEELSLFIPAYDKLHFPQDEASTKGK